MQLVSTSGLAALLAATLLTTLPAGSAQLGQTYVVTVASDLPDGDLSDGVCSTVLHNEANPNPPDPATCTLRAAIQTSDLDADKDRIEFGIPVSGVATITLTAYLPDLHHPIEIDGWTQLPTRPSGDLVQPPAVRIDGQQLTRIPCDDEFIETGPFSQNRGRGLVLFGADSLVQGLNLSGFPCDDIFVYRAPRTKISGNYIGTNRGGDRLELYEASANKDGVYVDQSPQSIIGGTQPFEGNVVTTPVGFGIFVVAGSDGTVIRHNKVGVNPAGDAPTGVWPRGAPRAGIAISGRRGEQLVAITAPVVADNQVAGLDDLDTEPAAIVVGSNVTGARIERNVVGLDADGRQMVVDGLPFSQPTVDGILVRARGTDRETRDTIIEGNIVSAMGNGIVLQGIGVHRTRIAGNLVGVTRDRRTPVPNDGIGVVITEESHHNVVGYGRTDSFAAPCTTSPHCNVIAHNKVSGVALETPPLTQPPRSISPAGPGNTIRGNSIFLNGGPGVDRPGFGITANNVEPGNTEVDFPVGVTRSTVQGTTVVSGLVRGPDPRRSELVVDIYQLETEDQRPGPGVFRPRSTFGPDGFEVPAPDASNPSSFGEGREWVGAVPASAILPDGRWRLEVPGPVSATAAFTATVTDASGNTSEFSAFCADTNGDGNADDDGDALCDDWETYGIDEDGDGITDLALNSVPFNASPNRPDIFVEVDYMNGSNGLGQPISDGFQQVIEAFENALGREIALHVTPGSLGFVDELLPFSAGISYGALVGTSDFDDIKRGGGILPCGGHFGSVADRRHPRCAAILGAKSLVYRYVVFANAIDDALTSDARVDGRSRRGDNGFVIALGQRSIAEILNGGGHRTSCSSLLPCWAAYQAEVFMHELGHSLGLGHGGLDDVNWKPNHLSVMNYAYSRATAAGAKISLDYQRYDLPSLNEASLDDTQGIGVSTLPPEVARDLLQRWPFVMHPRRLPPSPVTSLPSCVLDSSGADGRPFGGIDWAFDGITSSSSANINELEFPECLVNGAEVLSTESEWDKLDYNFRDFSESGLFSHATPITPVEIARFSDPDGDAIATLFDNCPAIANPDQTDDDHDGFGDPCDALNNGADIAVALSTNPLSTPSPGAVVSHAVRVTNAGPEDATRVRIAVSFTPGFSPTSHDGGPTYVGTTWTLDGLKAGQNRTLKVVGTFNAPYTASVRAIGADQSDPQPGNDVAIWYAGPTAPGNPVPVQDIPPDAFYCVAGDDDGASGYDTRNVTCVGNPTLAAPGQADLAVSIVKPREATVAPGHVLSFRVTVEKLNTAAAVTGVRVSLPLPSATQLIRAEPGQLGVPGNGGWYDASTGVWEVGALSAARSKSLHLVLESTGTGPVTLTAQLARADQVLANTSNDAAAVTAGVPVVPAPANDDVSAAVELTGPAGTIAGTTVGATSERFEPYGIVTAPPHTTVSHGGQDRASVWYRWLAPATGVLMLLGRSPGRSLLIDIHEGPPTALRSIARSANGLYRARVEAGHWYTIAVISRPYTSAFADAWTDFELVWELRTPPPNDQFARAVMLTSASGTLPASTFASTTEGSEPRPVAELEGTMWYRFDSRVAGTFRFSADRAGVIAYAGDRLGSLQVLARGGKFTRGQDDGLPGNGSVEFDVAPGRTYFVAAGVAGNLASAVPYTAVQAMTDGSVSWQLTVTDSDGDGVRDDAGDNCPAIANPDQTDEDDDGVGDACAPPPADGDGDGVADTVDNCIARPNATQGDEDEDGVGDACDADSTADADADGVIDPLDVCVDTPDAAQTDSDGDGRGDACDPVDPAPTVVIDNPDALITSGAPVRYAVTLRPALDVDEPHLVLTQSTGLRFSQVVTGAPWYCTPGPVDLRCTLFARVEAGVAAPVLTVEYVAQAPYTVECAGSDACVRVRALDGTTGRIYEKESAVAPFSFLDLRLQMAPAQLLVLPGAYLDVDITATNAGTGSASDQWFELRPLSGAVRNARIHGAANGWSCMPGGGLEDSNVVCSRTGTLEPGDRAPQVTLRFELAPSMRYASCLAATSAPRCIRVYTTSRTPGDPTHYDGPTVEIGILGGPVLEIDLDDQGAIVTQGSRARYGLTITNHGAVPDAGPIVIGLSTCLPNGACQQAVASFEGPVAPEAAQWTCTSSTGDGRLQTCSHAGPLAPGGSLRAAFEWITRTNASSFPGCGQTRGCVYVRATVGEAVGAGEGPSDVEISPLTPVWSVPTIDGRTATISGPASTDIAFAALSSLPLTPPPPDQAALPFGLLSLRLDGVTPGATAALELTWPSMVNAHYGWNGIAWERFDWNGVTGAQFEPGSWLRVTVQDGGRGDNDGVVNGSIEVSGAPGSR